MARNMNRPLRMIGRWVGVIILLGGIVWAVQWGVMRLARPVVTVTRAVEGWCEKNGVDVVTATVLEEIRARMPTPKVFGAGS